MPWAKVSDGLHDHPKVERLIDEEELRGLAALGLWVLGLSYAADHLTDGRLARSRVSRMAPRTGRDLAERLVRSGLWDPTEDGFAFHDWADCNPSGEDLERVREARSRGGKAAAAKRWGPSDPPSSRGSSGSSSHGSSDGSSASSPVATRARSRPVPVPSRQEDQPPPEVGADGGSAPSSPADPWGLAPDGEDPDAWPVSPVATTKGKGKADLPLAELSFAERRAYDAIVTDPNLAPIVPRPARLARDLLASGPAVDVPLAVRTAGAWMRGAGARGAKKNGTAFLLSWVRRDQERGGTRGGGPGAPPPTAPGAFAEGPERRPPPKAPPVPRVIAERAAELLRQGQLGLDALDAADAKLGRGREG